MPTRSAKAGWKDTVSKGQGALELGSGAFKGAYSYASRFEEGKGTNPEELIGAAHAGCFSMAFALELEKAGYPSTSVVSEARVTLDPNQLTITDIALTTEGIVEGITNDEFQKIAQAAKDGCPVSKALAGVNISLNARLKG